MKSSKLIPILLAACVVIVAIWEVLANRSNRPFGSFSLTASDFTRFVPEVPGWSITSIEVAADNPLSPNVAAFLVKRLEYNGGNGERRGIPVLVRLVHGYNMCDCLRMKGYKVELLKDEGGGVTDELKEDAGGRMTPVSESETQPSSLIPHPSSSSLPRVQTWRTTSSVGDVQIARSTIIRSTDFGGTTAEVRDMAFPRIVDRIGSEWDWEGFKASSLRHPVKSLVMVVKVKWNNARCDLLTFLKLRQPAWASTDYFTFLATTHGVRFEAGDEPRVTEEVHAAQLVVYGELLRWRAEQGP